MGDGAYTVDRDFCVPADRVEPTLAALNVAFGREFTALASAVEELTSFEDNEIDSSGAFLLGRHADTYLEDTTKLLAVLGRFAVEGSYVRFDGPAGELFGFRVLGGRLREESGDLVWTLDPGSPVGGDEAAAAGDEAQDRRVGVIAAPLVFSRDPEAFDAWWLQLAGHQQEEIGELLAGLRAEPCDLEFILHRLALAAFQTGLGPGEWLAVQGLRPGWTPSYVMLDLDPSYGTTGECDGVDVVATLHVKGGLSTKYFRVSVFDGFPARTLVVAQESTPPREQIAATVDAVLAMVNAEIARRDDFTQSARAVAAPGAA